MREYRYYKPIFRKDIKRVAGQIYKFVQAHGIKMSNNYNNTVKIEKALNYFCDMDDKKNPCGVYVFLIDWEDGNNYCMGYVMNNETGWEGTYLNKSDIIFIHNNQLFNLI